MKIPEGRWEAVVGTVCECAERRAIYRCECVERAARRNFYVEFGVCVAGLKHRNVVNDD